LGAETPDPSPGTEPEGGVGGASATVGEFGWVWLALWGTIGRFWGVDTRGLLFLLPEAFQRVVGDVGWERIRQASADEFDIAGMCL
jgi:hypothetical protein